MNSLSAPISNQLKRLREASWVEVIQTCYLILFAGMLLGLFFDSGIRREYVKPLFLALALGLFVAKDLSGAPEAKQRWRAARREGKGIGAQLCAFLPPGLVGLMRIDRALWRGCLQWICRRPNPATRPDGTALHYLNQGSYSTVIGIALVSLLIELPITAAILPLFRLDPALTHKLHILLAAGCLYSLVWVLGDRWHVKGGYHVLTDDTLDLRIGVRARARIPFASIVACERVSETRQQWCRKHGVKARDTMVISPFDQPNVVLTLAPDASVPVSLLGVERMATSRVFLYVDRPEMLIHRTVAVLRQR